jgi:hypothetical protein
VASTSYTKTQSNNQCTVDGVSRGFCTALTTRGGGVVPPGPRVFRPKETGGGMGQDSSIVLRKGAK